MSVQKDAVEELDNYKNPLLGLTLLGRVVGKSEPVHMELLGFILMVEPNKYQNLIAGALFYRDNKRLVESAEDKLVADGLFANVQSILRFEVSAIFENDDDDYFIRKSNSNDQAIRSLALEHKANNKPHAQGTVAEIAEKLGVSKSEVRKMKQNGTLDEALSKIQ